MTHNQRSRIFIVLPIGAALVLLLAFFLALPGGAVAAPQAPTAPASKIIVNEFYRDGTLSSGNEWIELLVVQDLTAAELENFFVGDSTSATEAKYSGYQFTGMGGIATSFPRGTLVVIGGDAAFTEDASYNPAGNDWNLFLQTSGSHLTGNGSNGDLAGTDVAYIDTDGTNGNTTISANGFAVNWDASPGTLGANANVLISVPANVTGAALFSGLEGSDNAANWTSSIAPASLTPGLPNGGDNTAYIAGLRSGGTDVPPTVSSTTPANSATNVALDNNITINFSENVTVTGTWFNISCASSLTHTAVVSGGPQNFTLNPEADFSANEVCTVTIYAAQVVDQDGTADNMAANYVFSFTTIVPTCGNSATLIHAIQGSGEASPEEGNLHTIEGVVVGDYQAPGGGFNGFFVQEEDAEADSDPLTSEGLFVYDGSSPAVDVNIGDIVRVTGTVAEYNGLTEITSLSNVEICLGSATASAAAPTLPVANLADWEWYEGMLVNFTQTLYVTEHYNLGRYGEISLSVNDRLFNPTQVISPGLEANALQGLNDRSRIQLNDAATGQNPDPIIYPSPELSATNALRGGDSLPGLTGVLNYAFDSYLIEPVEPITFTHGNPRPATPASVGGSLQVASFNVLNYFSTIDSGPDICGPSSNLDCRGADSASEFTRQRDKIINALLTMDADIVGLMEIENHASDAAVDNLVNGLNAIAGAGTYAKVATGPIGSDAIKVALIYQPAAATPIGTYAILDDSFDANYHDDKNRPALAQTFSDTNGGRVTVIVNHLKSKSSDCNDLGDPDTGDGQGNCNLTRTAAANILLTWLATDPTTSGSPNFLIIGDLNSYAMEDPIAALETGGFTNLYRTFSGDDYSYAFEGQWGTLDYSLASAALLPGVTGVAAWHINGDEPRVLDYNEEFKSIHQLVSLYAPDAYRASDHDPIIVGLNLSFELPSASFVSNSPITLGENSVFTNTSTGEAPLTYLWDFGDSITSTLESPSHTYEQTGTFTVTLTVTNVYGSDVATGTHTVAAVKWEIFLPIIFKNSGD